MREVRKTWVKEPEEIRKRLRINGLRLWDSEYTLTENSCLTSLHSITVIECVAIGVVSEVRKEE